MRQTAAVLVAISSLVTPVAGSPLANATPPAATPIAEKPKQGCVDFLAQMHKRPAHLDYIGCSYLPGRQGKPLSATYRVEGRYAAATEAYLIRFVGLNRLKRSCCQWDSPRHEFRNAQHREFSINMVSAQAPARTRAQWPTIPIFQVTVETFTEEI